MSQPVDLVTPYPWRRFSLRLRYMQELSPVAGGQVTARDLGPAVWTCDAETPPMEIEAADAMMANFGRLRGSMFSFLANDPFRPALSSLVDPASIAAAAALPATVQNIRADRAALRIGGLSNDLVFLAGDKISVLTSAGGREYFRLRSGGNVTAGVSAELEVEPHIRPAVVVGNSVSLVAAPLEMRIEPNTLDDPTLSLVHRRVVFKAVQVIR